MNALGKVLTIFVFLGSLVWMGFTAALFATRSDWRTAANNAAKDAADTKAAADSLRKQIEEERAANKTRVDSLEQQVNALTKERASLRKNYDDLKAGADKVAAGTQAILPTIDKLAAENKIIQLQADELTKENKTITFERDKAALAAQDAKNKENDAKLQLNVTQKALEDAIEKGRSLADAARGGAADADAEFRGDVLEVSKERDIIVFSGGANAGVKAGKRYVVRRSVAPFYVGTVVVLDASDPKMSSGVFTPAAGQKLGGEYVPKKGDTVSSN